MKTASVILLSWGLTLLLLGFNVALYKTRAYSPKPQLEGFKSLTNTVKRVVRYRPTPPPPPPPPPPFTWDLLEAEEYPVYIANLRGVACPEKTIRDIILADLEKYYEGREELLVDERNRKFWRTGAQIDRDQLQYEKKSLALAHEKRALIKELLGVDVDAESLKVWRDERIAAILAGFMPDPKPERAVACYLRGKAEAQAQRAMTGGITTPADLADQEKLFLSLRAELGSIMTPGEMDELQFRLALIDHELVGVEMSGAELRQYARLKALGEDPFRDVFDLKAELSEVTELATQKKLAEEVAKLLGPGRVADYMRSQDRRFQEVFELTDKHQLPKATAIKLFEIRSAVDAQMERARADTSLTDEQRFLYFGSLRVQTEQAFVRYLGPKIFEEYQQQKLGDKWFTGTSLDPAPARPPGIQIIK